MNKERIKSLILTILISASVIQVGILWNRQSHGLPIRFLSALVQSGKNIPLDYNAAREDFFVPAGITLSTGDECHWVVQRESENFQSLWKEASSYLKTVLASEPDEVLPGSSWASLVMKKSVAVELATPVDSELTSWFMGGIKLASTHPAAVYKLLISPWETVNTGQNTLYLYDGTSIYKYSTGMNPQGLDRQGYGKVLEEYADDPEQRVYMIIKEIDPNGKFPVTPDVLWTTTGPKATPYPVLSVAVPQLFSKWDGEGLAEAILRAEKESFYRSVDSQGTMMFANTDNVYRLYDNGLLEYAYLSSVKQAGRGSIAEAFRKTCEFIDRIRTSLKTKGGTLYLSAIHTNMDSYTFTFDYRVEDMPVWMEYPSAGRDRKPVTHALVVEAGGGRVLNSRWLMKDFIPDTQLQQYEIYSENVLEQAANLYENLGYITDIRVSYEVKQDGDEKLKPVWAIGTDDGKRYMVPMRKFEGEP